MKLPYLLLLSATVTPFSIAFEHGDMCPGTNIARSTVIHFECEAESTTSIPDYDDENNCTTTFTWRSFSACRKCIDNILQKYENIVYIKYKKKIFYTIKYCLCRKYTGDIPRNILNNMRSRFV
jgi:hypothetical protein